MTAPSDSTAEGSADPLHRLVTGHRHDPVGIPAASPLLSWSAAGDGGVEFHDGFEVRVATSATGLTDPDHVVWTARSDRPWLVYGGPALTSRERLYWNVTARQAGGVAMTSRPAGFEVGLTRPDDWQGSWLSASPHPFRRESWDPCPYLRRSFALDEVPIRARLYATALGLYRVWVNGTELTADAHLRPGWTDYRMRVYHQTYDCTSLLRPGENVIAAAVAPGWYAGWVGLVRRPGLYGDQPAFRAQLETVAGDGARSTIATDRSWRLGHGELIAADLIRGEIRDLRQEPRGWQAAGFDDAAWAVPDVYPDPDGLTIEPQPHDSVRTHRLHEGHLVHEHGRGPVVFDFGQNLVGWTRIESPLQADVELIVRHGELLTPSKRVYRENLRGAFQEDRYVAGDEGPHRVEPSFTLHGFRYAEVWGLPPAEPDPQWHDQSEPPPPPPKVGFRLHPETTVTAVSVEAGHELVGSFTCSDERLDALARAVEWTIRGNFLEVATDCPQRDERMGWLGDAGVIAPTAAYVFDLAAFTAKFAQDAADAQMPDGSVPSYVPPVPPTDRMPGAPGWSDGFVRLVHLLVERYADLPTAERLYDHVARFADHLDRENPDGIRVNAVGANFGDWLSLPEHEGHTIHPGYEYTGAYSTSPRQVIATAHSYRTFVEAAAIATRLGRDSDAARYAERAEHVRQAYLTAFVAADGTTEGDTQAVYAVGAGLGLLRGPAAETAADHLARLIRRRGHLTTGIHGTAHVLGVLARHGHGELAMDMLLRTEYPGWLHMLARGGTTIWERWDGIGPDGALATAEMNSFNHYALGAVGRFLYENLAGLDATATTWDGRVGIEALYPSHLEWARASYRSPVGPIESEWRRDGSRIRHSLTVPATAHADVRLPAGMSLRTGVAGEGAQIRLGPGRHDLTIDTGNDR